MQPLKLQKDFKKGFEAEYFMKLNGILAKTVAV